jgi:hypothetical protein
MRRFRPLLIVLALGLAPLLASCDVSDIVGDCQISTDNFAGNYSPNETKSFSFRVGCAGTITVFWTCPQCPDPNAGRLVLLDPLGAPVFELLGAGFGGKSRSQQTLLEGQWTILIQGTGGSFINNFSVDVTYPSL